VLAVGQVGYHISFRSRTHGPISSGMIHRHVRDYEKDVARELAEQAEGTWLFKLDMRLRHKTPYYTTQIDKRPIAWNRWKVHDNGVIYGHWLEGTGSRNAPNSIFPGYWSLRDTKAELGVGYRRREVAEEVLEKHQARGRLI
jgi:hypothetical protein